MPSRPVLFFVLLAALSSRAGAAAPERAAALAGDAGPRCSGEAATPAKLTLQVGKSTLMRLPEAVQHRSVGDPGVVQAMLVAPDTLYIVGVDVGGTNMIIQGKSGLCSVLDVTVGMDPAALQATLAALMPEEKGIRVSAAADTLVLSGSVDDATAVQRAVELAGAYVRRPVRALALARKGEDGAAAPAVAAPAAGAGAGAGGRIINLLSVGAPQQVMLEVQIAEVSKSLLDKLEVGTTLRYTSGSWATTLLSNFLTGTTGGLLDLRKSNGNQVTLAAQKRDGLVRILAEPTVMAISGQEGSFLAGGKIFVPVAQDNGKVSLEEKEFGVGLRFTPTVLAGGRINLKVAPEVSEVSREGVGISAAGFTGGAVLPLITTRRAATTVQLFDGQSYAIGGLIKNNQVSNIKGLPVLGELPVLGALFRSTDFQHDRSELLFVITAHLVKPLPPDYVLPTEQLRAPGRSELFLGGRMEGAAPPPAAAAAPPPQATRGFELK
ncbi:type II and III secretion system protein family protein [Janthinobacterium fluminis]|uniref:Type II and III secretion system protein family protein n=1 Tax=Janthinobacterium fluminis TaxID=2987524 RepID=A0ABT5K6H2_9BURK|nr:type II and III secretion system protein family protein [Janthinobacterium fluminis]MDC8760499.1 type II and III secretion system protein family protein [Janthinobacterium fluminis]